MRPATRGRTGASTARLARRRRRGRAEGRRSAISARITDDGRGRCTRNWRLRGGEASNSHAERRGLQRTSNTVMRAGDTVGGGQGWRRRRCRPAGPCPRRRASKRECLRHHRPPGTYGASRRCCSDRRRDRPAAVTRRREPCAPRISSDNGAMTAASAFASAARGRRRSLSEATYRCSDTARPGARLDAAPSGAPIPPA